MMDEGLIRILRAQAWERAKGELRSVKHTFFGKKAATEGQFGDYDNLVEKFINDVESRGLAE